MKKYLKGFFLTLGALAVWQQVAFASNYIPSPLYLLGRASTWTAAQIFPAGTKVPNTVTFLSEQVFTGNGTYTPTAGMMYVDVIVCGSGGGGGGADSSAVSGTSAGGGGGAGGCAQEIITAATIGVSQAVTVPAGGTAGTSAGGSGGNGGTSSLGALITATGGNGGVGTQEGADTSGTNDGGTGGTGASGNVNLASSGGSPSFWIDNGTILQAKSGNGGSNFVGSGAKGVRNVTGSSAVAGVTGGGCGGGGSGAASVNTATGAAGGVGGAGCIIITEYGNN